MEFEERFGGAWWWWIGFFVRKIMGRRLIHAARSVHFHKLDKRVYYSQSQSRIHILGPRFTALRRMVWKKRYAILDCFQASSPQSAMLRFPHLSRSLKFQCSPARS